MAFLMTLTTLDFCSKKQCHEVKENHTRKQLSPPQMLTEGLSWCKAI